VVLFFRNTWWILAAFSPACLVVNPDFEASSASDSGATSSASSVAADVDESDATSATAAGSDAGSSSSSTTTTSSSSSSSSSTSTDPTDTQASATAADQLCDRVECGPNATCELIDGETTCACDPGFIPDRDTCVDLDECANDPPCGAGFCQNFPGDYACVFPKTCAELKALAPATPDGAYQLYVDGQEAKPWLAWCHDMANAPREYLTLPEQDALDNLATYRSSSNFRITQYKKIRLDPMTWKVDTADATFSADLGLANYLGQPVNKVAYAAGIACPSGLSGANVDLQNTPFKVTSQWCVGGSILSHSKTGSGQVIDITVSSGTCGWHAPDLSGCPVAPNPVNGVGPALQLEYIPP